MKPITLLFLLIPLILVSCFSAKEGAMQDEFYYQTQSMEEAEPYAGLAETGRSMNSSLKMDDSSQSMLNNIAAMKAEQNQQDEEKTLEPLRIYNGEVHLMVEDVQQTRKQIEGRVEQWGGYLESSFDNVLIVRIPAKLFHESFAELLSYGKVLDERIETWDVTEQYQDLQGRLSVAEQTRDRLYNLLERSTDPEERSRILREIGRLTEEIEQISLNMQSLSNRAALSGISIRLESRVARVGDSRRTIPFSWIANLNPLYPVSHEFKGSLELEMGPSFAIFEDAEIFRAENPQGVILRMSTLENDPRGDSIFWQNALLFHLKDYYAEAVPLEIQIGDKTLLGADFISKDREPYRYMVALVADGKQIELLEIFLPDPNWNRDDLTQVLNQGRLK